MVLFKDGAEAAAAWAWAGERALVLQAQSATGKLSSDNYFIFYGLLPICDC